jgi:DNA-binding CsgD family transcriptional regulator
VFRRKSSNKKSRGTPAKLKVNRCSKVVILIPPGGSSNRYEKKEMMQTPLAKILRELLYRLGFQRRTQRLLQLDEELLHALGKLAQQEQRTEEEVAVKLLASSLAVHHQAAANIHHWDELSEREKQVVALVCLRYTNRQIAGILHLSPETVKTHVQHALHKFGLRTKEELRILLNHWDFSEWEPREPLK